METRRTEVPLASDASWPVLGEGDVNAVCLLDESLRLRAGEREAAACVVSSETKGAAASPGQQAAQQENNVGGDARQYLMMLAQRAEGLFGSSCPSFSRWW